jgi:hypothetical protein
MVACCTPLNDLCNVSVAGGYSSLADAVDAWYDEVS